MSEATRDVTVRVSVVGGKVDKFPDFAKMTTAAEGFLQTVESGLKILKSDSETAFAATSKLTDQLREAASMNFGDLGLGEARAAVEEVAAAVEAVNDVGNVDLGGITDSTSGVNDVTSAIEALNEEISQSVTGLEASWAAADQLAESGKKLEDDLTSSIESATQAAENLAQAELDAKYEVESATEAVETATKQEGATAAETAFRKIALAERFAAHQRKVKDETIKQEKEKEAAFKKSGEEQQKQMFAAGGALAQSLAAGAQFVATLQLIAGESPEIEALARQFAKVQGTIQGIAAGTQAFNSLNQGLAGLQAASAAATAQLAVTGSTATFTQGALIRLAPAAAMAQAALGPIGIAVAGISLAIVAVQTAASFFSDDMPEYVGESKSAVEELNDEITKSLGAIDRASNAVKLQNSLFEQQLELKRMIDGSLTTEDLKASVESNLKVAADAFTATIKKEIKSAELQIAKLKEQEQLLVAENMDLYGNDSQEATKKRQQNSQEAERLRAEIDALQVGRAKFIDQKDNVIGMNPENAAATMGELTAAITQIPEEFRDSFSTAVDEFSKQQIQILGGAYSDLNMQITDGSRKLKESQSEQDRLKDQFNREADIAAKLTDNPTKVAELNAAVASGKTVGESFDSIRGELPERLQEDLQAKFRQGNLVKADLQAALRDAADVTKEREDLNQNLMAIVESASLVADAQATAKSAAVGLKEKIKALQEEVRAIEMAVQAR